MHHKNIKLTVRKQLKKRYPNWNRLNRKAKKDISKKVLAEVVSEYDFNQDVASPVEDLLGLEEQVPTKGIITLQEMGPFIEKFHNNRMIRFSSYKRSPVYIKSEIKCVHERPPSGDLFELNERRILAILKIFHQCFLIFHP